MSSESPVPAVRASDADRERVAEVLRTAGADGQLDVEELDERLQAAYAARTRAELEPLTADLQGHHPAAAGARSFSVARGEGGSRWIVSVMSGADRRGHWRLARSSWVINVMGGSDLDLNDVELADSEVVMTVFSFWGGADIHVPEGLRVEVSNFAFMGGNDVRLGAPVTDPGAPLLRLRLISIMGGADVKRGRRLSRAERRALKDERRRQHLGH